MRLEYCGICDKGEQRKVNQDAILMDKKGKSGIFAVADGMGGHMHGEAASGIIIEEVKAWWEKLKIWEEKMDFREITVSLRICLEFANRKIYERYCNDGVCGSTVVVLLIYKQNYCIYSSGDSRIYFLNGFLLKQLTSDDVWENQQIVREKYSSFQIRHHENYGRLVHAIGIADKANISGRTDTLKDNDSFLLCSDGLYKMCSEKELKRWMREYRNGKRGSELPARMLETVYKNGAKDNISIVLVRWKNEC